MKYLLDVAQVSTLEETICKVHDLTLTKLMHLAGAAVWHRLVAQYGGIPQSMLFFLGSGHNAGDGLICAQYAQKAGVNVFLYQTKPLKAKQCIDIAEALQADFKDCWCQELTNLKVDIVVDAMLGIGFSGSLSDEMITQIQLFNSISAYKVAIDIPSGIDANNGYGETYCQVNHTITFFAPKVGHFFAQGAHASQKITVALKHFHENFGYAWIAQSILPKLPENAHKYQRGVVYVVAGYAEMQGAGIMAAEAALYSGAGVVNFASIEPCKRSLHPAIMQQTYSTTTIDACVRHHGVCLVGPGMGQGKLQHDILAYLLTRDLVLVIDAEGLRNLSHDQVIQQPCVLTPHIGEAAYLLNTTTLYVIKHPIEAALSIQRRYQCAVVLKSNAIIIAMNEQIAIITQGTVELATAGSGDVLAGIIAALIAQHGYSLEVIQAAVVMHSEQGRKWRKKHDKPMVATDIYLER